MTLIKLLTLALMVASVFTVARWVTSPRSGSRYGSMVLLLLWTVIVGGYIINK